jgi:OOP family OmpA-OmpF porin
MRRIAVFATTLALALVATPAVLANGFYVGGAFGQTSADIDGASMQGFGSSVDVDDTDTGYKLFGGYNFMKHFSVEAGYVDVGESSIDATAGTLTSSMTAEADGFSASAVGILPIGERFNVFAKYGFYQWDAEVTASMTGLGSFSASDDGTDPTYGLGFGWNVSERSNLRFEADRYELDTLDVDTYTVGYAFSF